MNFLFKFTMGQDLNSSFVYSDFSTVTLMPVTSLTETDDGGFAYVKAYQPWNFSRLDTNKIKIVSLSRVKNTEDYTNSDVICILFKVGKDGKINFAKLLNNFSGGLSLKQTKDRGYIITGFGNITKLDKNGNLQWQLYFDKDSIPGIKKSKFLTETPINDITECSEGSFIALFDASFSLLKISKDGKLLWLKSTVFDEFSPMFFDYYAEQKLWIEKTDSVGINKFIYQQGGGVYIPTYNVYETEDGAYMAIGKNEYRYKDFISDYTDSSKVFYTTKDISNGGFEKIGVPRPEKIYGIRKYPLNESEKAEFPKQSTTVVVKTDKDGKVLWTKQFGDLSYDTKPHSDLIKLANGKWMVRIRDCSESGGCASRVYIIDNNGNLLTQTSIAPGICDPWGMALAADSSFYLYEQDIVSKTDKNLKVQWQRKFGGSLTDVGIHAVMADTGVLSTESGVIYKFDKYGNKPFSGDTTPITFSVSYLQDINSTEQTKTKAFLHVKIHSKSEGEYVNIAIVRKDSKEIDDKDYIRYAYILDDENRKNKAIEKKQEYQASNKKLKKGQRLPWYFYVSGTNIGRYDKKSKSYILDLNDTCQLNALILEQKTDTLPAVEVDIPRLYGFKEFYLTDLSQGDYYLEFTDAKGETVYYRKEFSWKP